MYEFVLLLIKDNRILTKWKKKSVKISIEITRNYRILSSFVYSISFIRDIPILCIISETSKHGALISVQAWPVSIDFVSYCD